jgi:hypothetical protein
MSPATISFHFDTVKEQISPAPMDERTMDVPFQLVPILPEVPNVIAPLGSIPLKLPAILLELLLIPPQLPVIISQLLPGARDRFLIAAPDGVAELGAVLLDLTEVLADFLAILLDLFEVIPDLLAVAP